MRYELSRDGAVVKGSMIPLTKEGETRLVFKNYLVGNYNLTLYFPIAP